MAGALCAATFPDDVIPGRGNPDGQASRSAEEQANAFACARAQGQAVGSRPRCWFSSKLHIALSDEGLSVQELEGNGNGVPEPGETVDVRAPLVSRYRVPVGGAVARARVLRDGVRLLEAEAAYGALPTDTATAPLSGFRYSLWTGVPCGALVPSEVVIRSPMGRDVGSFAFRVGRLEEGASFAGTSGLAIPDADAAGVRDVIQVEAQDFAVAQAVVDLAISHTFIGDLAIALIDAGGKRHVLKAMGDGGAQSGLQARYTVELPAAPAEGAWTLEVADWAAADVGTLDSWSLQLTKAVCG